MWTKGSRARRSTPANARRTGKPSPSRPVGAVVTDATGRSRATIGSTLGMCGSVNGFSTVTAGISGPPHDVGQRWSHVRLERRRGHGDSVARSAGRLVRYSRTDAPWHAHVDPGGRGGADRPPGA